jgi:hypothetical protein
MVDGSGVGISTTREGCDGMVGGAVGDQQVMGLVWPRREDPW